MPDTFPLFINLPAELRLQVWRLTVEGRVVTEGCDFPGKRSSISRPHRPAPAIFYINYESRSFALSQYHPFLGTYLHPQLDRLCSQGLYYDYLGADLVTVKLQNEWFESRQEMSLKSPFDKVHVTFMGPWAEICNCVFA